MGVRVSLPPPNNPMKGKVMSSRGTWIKSKNSNKSVLVFVQQPPNDNPAWYSVEKYDGGSDGKHFLGSKDFSSKEDATEYISKWIFLGL